MLNAYNNADEGSSVVSILPLALYFFGDPLSAANNWLDFNLHSADLSYDFSREERRDILFKDIAGTHIESETSCCYPASVPNEAGAERYWLHIRLDPKAELDPYPNKIAGFGAPPRDARFSLLLEACTLRVLACRAFPRHAVLRPEWLPPEAMPPHSGRKVSASVGAISVGGARDGGGGSGGGGYRESQRGGAAAEAEPAVERVLLNSYADERITPQPQRKVSTTPALASAAASARQAATAPAGGGRGGGRGGGGSGSGSARTPKSRFMPLEVTPAVPRGGGGDEPVPAAAAAEPSGRCKVSATSISIPSSIPSQPPARGAAAGGQGERGAACGGGGVPQPSQHATECSEVSEPSGHYAPMPPPSQEESPAAPAPPPAKKSSKKKAAAVTKPMRAAATPKTRPTPASKACRRAILTPARTDWLGGVGFSGLMPAGADLFARPSQRPSRSGRSG